ncbi:MAG: FHA domain-containing protein [Chroococcidiopsidaceae cyanobacterium CP_BM_ER_R8_30]|nr:FHA domain-containing protein [Chroococcidiopsidaceae cyanobacterium CP_BM_ER_R8_30]
MTGSNLSEGFLRQVLSVGAAEQEELRYPLLTTQEVLIGRESGCQIYLDYATHNMVSRRHVAIRPLSTASGYSRWEICDLNSSNGTYVNGQRLQGCRELQPNDRIRLGKRGPEFVFERARSHYAPLFPSLPAPVNTSVGRSSRAPSSAPQNQRISLTRLFPIVSTGLTKMAFLVPGAITIIFFVLLFFNTGRPAWFELLLVTYLALGALYFVYRLWGKPKP